MSDTVSIDIRNLRNAADQAAKTNSLFSALRLQAKLNQQYNEALTEMGTQQQLNITPVAQPRMTVEQMRKDVVGQRQIAQTNLRSIMSPDEADKTLNQLDDRQIFYLNSNFGDIANALKGRTNITADFFGRVFQRYIDKQKATKDTGVEIPMNEDIQRRLNTEQSQELRNIVNGQMGIDPETGRSYTLDQLLQNLSDESTISIADLKREISRLRSGGPGKELFPGPGRKAGEEGEEAGMAEAKLPEGGGGGAAEEIPGLTDKFLTKQGLYHASRTVDLDFNQIKSWTPETYEAIDGFNAPTGSGERIGWKFYDTDSLYQIARILGANVQGKDPKSTFITAIQKAIADGVHKHLEPVSAEQEAEIIRTTPQKPHKGAPYIPRFTPEAEGEEDEEEPHIAQARERVYSRYVAGARREAHAENQMRAALELQQMAHKAQEQQTKVDKSANLIKELIKKRASQKKVEDAQAKLDEEKAKSNDLYAELERQRQSQQQYITTLPDRINQTEYDIEAINDQYHENERQIEALSQKFVELEQKRASGAISRYMFPVRMHVLQKQMATLTEERNRLAEERSDLRWELENYRKIHEAIPDVAHLDAGKKISRLIKRAGHRASGHGLIVQTRHHRRIVGKGVEVNSKETHKQFGKYLIHLKSLKKGVLNIKFPSFASIPSLPQTQISQPLTQFIHHILETGEFNKRIFNQLSAEDQALFKRVARKSEIDETLGMGIEVDEETRKDLERFNLVRGECVAGNNSPEVLKELRYYLLKFKGNGTIGKREADDLLTELVCLA